MTGSDPRQTRSFRLRLKLARLVVAAERLWPALWPSIAVLGVFVAFSLFGLWLELPRPLHVLLLLAFVGLFTWSLWRVRGLFRVASRDAGLARLEHDSGATHQPLRGLEDTLPNAVADPVTRRLWALHRERLLASLRQVRLAPPRSDLPRRDPWALRAALLLVLVVALVHGRGEIGQRLGSAFQLGGRPAEAGPAASVDLWITPPPYTRRAPLTAEQTRGQTTLAVPAGSEVRVQAHHVPQGDVPAGLAIGEKRQDLTALGPGSGEARAVLESDGFLAVTDGTGREIARWFVDVLPDQAPTVRFDGEPRATHREVLRVQLAAEDDYGLAEIALLLSPAGREQEVERFSLLKPSSQPAKLGTGAYQDLTAHPLAGLSVVVRLEAVDAAGQKGQSEPLAMVLPERAFQHPLARAVIAQRRELVAHPDHALDIAGALRGLADTRIAQELAFSVPLSLRVASSRLAFNEGDAAVRRSVVDLLWELALFIEDGALSVAERKLRDLQERLQQALDQNAEDQELEQLMQELQQAMDEFLNELARQAMQQGQDPRSQETMPIDPSRTVDRRDLQEMLDRARELMRSGARDAAREMLAQLQEMLENLRAGQQQAQPSPGEQNLSDLQKMIQLQQQLLDRSFQMDRQQRQNGQQQEGQPQQGMPQQGEPQQGQQQGQPSGQGQMGQAAAEQEALRRALGELMRRMGEAGMEIPRALGQAEMQMRGARGSLQEGDPGMAAEAQSQAIDAMQRAGQAMMEQLQEQMAQQQGPGPGGQPQPVGRRGRDPLGRSMRNEGGMDTHGVEVPEEGDLSRARDVLDELYRRSNDRTRAPMELDYYQRLLDRF